MVIPNDCHKMKMTPKFLPFLLNTGTHVLAFFWSNYSSYRDRLSAADGRRRWWRRWRRRFWGGLSLDASDKILEYKKFGIMVCAAITAMVSSFAVVPASAMESASAVAFASAVQS